MTTIAYRDGTLAADTLGCGGVRRRTKKLHRVGDAILGLSGNYGDCWQFVHWWADQSKALEFRVFRTDNSDSPDLEAIVVTDGGAEIWTEHLQPTPVLEPFFAIGSGAKAAMAAMHMGATAAKAVEIAMRVDPYTAGAIETMEA